jgi:alpha-L-fucosidase
MTFIRHFIVPSLFTLAAATSFAATPVKPTKTEASAEGVTVEAAQPERAALKETPEQRDARMRWWREAKFGLFIHWGVYAVPAGKFGDKDTYGEWIMHSAKISVAEYRGFARRFNPVKYDPAQWAAIAKDAGMRYIVITSKHHDGFALFPSDVTAWDIADATPYKKDLLGPLVSAAHREGLKIGFYYSQAQDWNNPGGAKARYKEGEGWDDAHKGDFDDYLKNLAAPQVREILTRYPIDILWWDTPTWMNAQRTAPLAALTALRPGLITNNRLGAGYGGDTATPEQFVPITGYQGDWETCMTMNGHWGYNAADQSWKSTADLIHKLADICAKGGNFLLNVGPTAEGEFPPACVERLRGMGRWLRVNGEAIYGTSAGPFAHLSWGVATRKGNRLYLHVFDWPVDGKLRVPLKNNARRAMLLVEPRKKLSVARDTERLVINVPAEAPDAIDSVVVLEIDGEPVVPPLPTASATTTASASLPDAAPANALDGTGAKLWRAPADVKFAWLEVDLGQPVAISGFGLDEPDVWPRMKQKFTLEIPAGDSWQKVAEGETDGHGVKENIATVTSRKFRLTMECDKGSPGVAELQLYRPE